MNENVKLYSDMERYEIINYNDGERYGYLGNNDVVVDDDGNLRGLIINDVKAKFSLFKSSGFTEIPWEHVVKIGSKVIIIDANFEQSKKARV